MAKVTVGINGFGRIGRAFMRRAYTHKDDVEVVAVNDLGAVQNLAYLLAHDSVYGVPPFSVSATDATLSVDGREIKVLSEKDPSRIPWAQLGVQVVVESTGVFDTFEKAKAHLVGGATHVVISAPAHDADANPDGGATILVGINEEKIKAVRVSSNASCTTNGGSPLMAILDAGLGIENALLNTIHAITGSQGIVDSSNKHNMREGRAAGQNIIPSSTGSAIAVTKALPELTGRFDGVAVRVPIICGSLVDITFVSKRPTTRDEVNDILRAAANDKRWEGIFTVTEEQLVSSDIVGNTHASIADLEYTRVVGGTLVKVFAWYDNEMGYAETLVRHVVDAGHV